MIRNQNSWSLELSSNKSSEIRNFYSHSLASDLKVRSGPGYLDGPTPTFVYPTRSSASLPTSRLALLLAASWQAQARRKPEILLFPSQVVDLTFLALPPRIIARGFPHHRASSTSHRVHGNGSVIHIYFSPVFPALQSIFHLFFFEHRTLSLRSLCSLWLIVPSAVVFKKFRPAWRFSPPRHTTNTLRHNNVNGILQL